MRAREFFEVADADDPRVPFTVRDYDAMTHRDMGRQLVAFRAWPTWRRGRLVVPWETIDPGRVHVVENLPAAGLYPEFAGILPTHQAGFADRGLVVCGYNSGTREPMFSYWLLGTRSPEKLARVMEDAMVNAGFAAEGLAGNASGTAVRARRATGRAGLALLPPVRGPLDLVIGVPRPGRQTDR